MSANISPAAISAMDANKRAYEIELAETSMIRAMRRQRLQDFLFHKITLLFALSVLIVLGGIIVSLAVGAWPAFKEFGFGFITRIEWDPGNDLYGGMIAIVGTLVA